MKKQITDCLNLMRQVFVQDKTSVFLTFITLVSAGFTILIWKLRLAGMDISYVWRVKFPPVQFLGLAVFLNTLLGLFSYNKEKEITYLLFGGSLFITILIFILQLFYLTNL